MKRFLPLPWLVEFNRYGGYDCMSAAYVIKSSNKDEYCIFEIDCPTHEEDPEIRALAEAIVEAVNNYTSRCV